MATVLLDTRDLGEAEAALSATYSKTRLAATSGDGVARMRIERTLVGSIGVDSVDYGCDLSFDMQPPAHILLCRVASGGVEERLSPQETERFEPGQVGAFGALDGQPFNGSVARGHYDQLVVERRLLGEVADVAPRTVGSVRLTGTRPVSSAANRHLASLIEHVRHVAANEYSAENPLITAALEHYVAATLLASFPSTALLEPTVEDRRDSTPVLLRRAMAFIDDNASSEISLADIADAVYVTPRALQYMFRKHRDCTPTEYLRRVRLDHAHGDLVAGSPSSTSVGDIARRWGFGHVGRFAVFYRENYGQSPHVTLRT
jgi:AraC-like DNA-binding protein